MTRVTRKTLCAIHRGVFELPCPYCKVVHDELALEVVVHKKKTVLGEEKREERIQTSSNPRQNRKVERSRQLKKGYVGF